MGLVTAVRTRALGMVVVVSISVVDPWLPVALAAPPDAQQITNADVIGAYRLGVPDADIIKSINKHRQTAFTFDPQSLKTLNDAHVSNAVLRAMFDSMLVSKTGNSLGVTTPSSSQPPLTSPKPAGPVSADHQASKDSMLAEKMNASQTASGSTGQASRAQYQESEIFPTPPKWCTAKNGGYAEIDFPKGRALMLSAPSNPSTGVDHALSRSLSSKIKIDATPSGAEIYTKSAVWVGYINRLRYSATLGGVVTTIEAPTVPQDIFTGNPAGTKAPSPGAPTGVGRPPVLDQTFQPFQDCFNPLQQNVKKYLHEFEKVNEARTRIVSALESETEPVLTSYDAARQRAKSALGDKPGTPPSIFPASVADFPVKEVVELKSRIDEFSKDYRAAFGKNPPDPKQFNQTVEAATTMSDDLGRYKSGSKEITDYQANVAFINYWFEKFDEVANANEADFIVDYQPACGGWFGQGTSTQVQLTIVDNYKPDVTIPVRNLVKVVCQPTISVSSGLALSFIPNQTPAFVPAVKKDVQGNPVLDANGNPVIVQSLGYSSQANVQPGYALQTNALLWGTRGGLFEIHWAAGAMLTASTGGVTTDIITGPAFSFRRRTFFISPLYDLGLRTQYLSQFGLGTLQGNLTSPPAHQVWKSGFGLTITFPFNSTTTQKNSSTDPGATPPSETKNHAKQGGKS